MKDTPPGYPVLSFCTSCGRDFCGDVMFDRHRVGTHEYTYSEGLRMDPPREDGRRCLDPDEMREKGWWPLSEEEKLASKRDACRAGFGVELWARPGTYRRALPREQVAQDATNAIGGTQ